MAPEHTDSADRDPRDEPEFEIANEFARVSVRKRLTRNGMRLEISSPRTDTGVMLDAMLLESLTWQSAEALGRFLTTPFQPMDESAAHDDRVQAAPGRQAGEEDG
jgi:hypothetical protein